MFRVSCSNHTRHLLANPITKLQREYASLTKVSKRIDEKLTPPKRPISAYLRFHQDIFRTLPPKQKTKVTEISKIIGEKWKALSEAEKKSYQDAAEKSRQEYLQEFKQFMDSLSPEDFLRLAQIRKENKAQGKPFPKFKDPNAPKKPATSYVIFLKEKYHQLNIGDNTDAFRKIAQEWRQISEVDRKYYEERAAADRMRYDQEIKQYKSGY